MAGYFFDTSALIKRYQLEQGTDVVDALFGEQDASFMVSRLSIVETVSALAMKVRAGELPLPDYTCSQEVLGGDCAEDFSNRAAASRSLSRGREAR